jgi:hypothetical protein
MLDEALVRNHDDAFNLVTCLNSYRLSPEFSKTKAKATQSKHSALGFL